MENKLAKRFIYNFLRDNNCPIFEDSNFYVEERLLSGRTLKKEYGIAVFSKRVKGAYVKFVEKGDWTEEMLEKALKVMIKEHTFFTYSALAHAQVLAYSGLYNDYLLIEDDLLEFEDVDWGVEEWEI